MFVFFYRLKKTLEAWTRGHGHFTGNTQLSKHWSGGSTKMTKSKYERDSCRVSSVITGTHVLSHQHVKPLPQSRCMTMLLLIYSLLIFSLSLLSTGFSLLSPTSCTFFLLKYLFILFYLSVNIMTKWIKFAEWRKCKFQLGYCQ